MKFASFCASALVVLSLCACSGSSSQTGGDSSTLTEPSASLPIVDPYTPDPEYTADPEYTPDPGYTDDPEPVEPEFTEGEQAYISTARFYLPKRKFSDKQVVAIGHRACALIDKYAVVGAGQRLSRRYHLDDFTGGFLAGAATTTGICTP